MFEPKTDGTLKSLLKGCSELEEIISKKPWCDMIQEVMDKLDSDLAVPAPPAKDLPQDPEERSACELQMDELLDVELLTQLSGDEDRMGEVEEWLQACQEHARQFVKFVVQPKSKDSSKELLQGSALVRMPVRGKYWGLVYDTKSSGEASAQANARVPNFRKEHLKKCLHAALQARGATELEENGLVFVLDGWRSLDQLATSAMVGVDSGEAFTDRCKSSFTILYDEAKLADRKSLVRGLIQQTEGMLVYSRGALALQRRDRKVYRGTTNGSVIGPVEVANYNDQWLVMKKVKELMLGEHGKVLASHGCPDAAPKPDIKLKSQEVEPACWFSMPESWYAELLHSFELGGLLDCNPLDIDCALACIKQKVPYIGLALTETMAQAMEKQLTLKLWEAYQDQKSALFQTGLVALISNKSKKRGSAGSGGQSPQRKKGKGRGRGRGKASGTDGPEDRQSQDRQPQAEGAASANAKGGKKGRGGGTASDILRRLQEMDQGQKA